MSTQNRPICTTLICHRRSGTTLTELLVAAGLLVTAMATVAPLSIQADRMLQDARQHQLAIQELSNQLERLSEMSADQLSDEIDELAPSPQIIDALPDPELSAEVVSIADETRLIVRLDWTRIGNPPPLELTGWLASADALTTTEPTPAVDEPAGSEAPAQ